MTFKDLNLDPRILRALEENGFLNPTPIQAGAIPEIMQGADLRASAQTGTGKTAAFLLPALQRIVSQPSFGQGPRVLILVPTRELAMQVAGEAEKYSRYLSKVKTVCIYGGTPYPLQRRQLSKPYEILVATPGRLIDFLEQGKISLARVEMFILDEADRMLDMGFIEPVEQIAEATSSTRQTLLFSATLKGAVLNLSKRLMQNPKEISVIPVDEKHENIQQHIYFVDHLTHKLNLLKHLLNDEAINQALIFTSTKQYAEELAHELQDMGFHAGALHGDMNQRQRARTLSRLRSGDLNFLVATDVAARGIDVSTISHVFNFDLPRCVEDYTHRIGRTGRAGAQGIALSFVSPKDHGVLKQIEAFTKQKLAPQVVVGLEPKIQFKPNVKEGGRFASNKPSFKKKRYQFKGNSSSKGRSNSFHKPV
jgi:superfamily II DNA/RNA helicase